jgi:hypothetical protein
MQEPQKEYVQQVCLLLIRNVELDKALLPLLMLADEVMTHEQLSQEQKTKSLAALQGVKTLSCTKRISANMKLL